MKSDIHKFNTHSKTEMRMLKMALKGEQHIHKDTFLKNSNQTLLTRWKASGYIKQVNNAEKGQLQFTDKFKKEVVNQLGIKPTYSSTGSFTHANGVAAALSFVPDTVSFLEIKNEDEIKSDFKELQKDINTPIINEKVSVPDLQVNMTREQLNEFKENLISYTNDMSNLSNRDIEHCRNSILRIEQVLETSEDTVINISIEVITNNYGEEEIREHLNYERVVNTVVLLIPTR